MSKAKFTYKRLYKLIFRELSLLLSQSVYRYVDDSILLKDITIAKDH